MGNKQLQFTQEQIQVIKHRGGHALVSAVAGSGKSTTMVELVACAVDEGMDPNRIMVIQYNTAAKESMEKKLRKRLGDRAPEARTFHSVGLQMRRKLVELGVLDRAELPRKKNKESKIKRDALQKAWKARYGSDAYLPSEMIGEFDQFVTLVKSSTLAARDLLEAKGYPGEYDAFPDAFDRMCRVCSAEGVIFFDDMLYHPYLALKADPDLWWHFAANRRTGGSAFSMIVVDEFQDANPVQFELLRGLAGLIPYQLPEEVAQMRQMLALEPEGPTTSVVAVGDDSQSIYGFRGAEVSLINEKFAQVFAPCTRYPLQRTFRFGHATSLLANHIITRNQDRDDKLTIAAPGNPDTKITRLTYKAKQPTGIVKAIERAWRENKLSRGVMLVRFYSMSIPYELELLDAGIPFHVYGREPLIHLPEIACLVAVLSLASNYWTIEEEIVPLFLRSLLQMPTLFLPLERMDDAELAMGKAWSSGESVTAAMSGFASTLDDRKMRNRVQERADMLQLFERGSMRDKRPGLVLDTYLRISGFDEAINRMGITAGDGDEVRRNVRTFIDMVSRYESMADVLDVLGPMAAFKKDKPPATDHLAIMSVHASKGLEWPTVILPGWAAGVYPRSNEGIEEERRLAYVAVTRAIHHLVFIHPEDPLFEESIANLTLPVPRTGTNVSEFLIDGEIGLCQRAAAAVRDFTPTHLQCRRAEVVTRYALEAGCDVLLADVPPNLLKQQQAMTNSKLPTLKPGTEVQSPDGHVYTVKSRVNQVYAMEPVAGGNPRFITDDEPGWKLYTP